MSTKTTFKRIALVAVAALGLGVLSVAPSNAAATTDPSLHSLAFAAGGTTATASITAGESATVSFKSSFVGVGTNDSVTVKAVLADGPSSGLSTVVNLDLTDSATSGGIGVFSTTNQVDGSTGATYGPAESGKTAIATYNATLYAPTVAGTYTVRIVDYYMSAASAATAWSPAITPLTFTVTVTAANTTAAANSTAWIRTAENAYNTGTASTDSAVVVSKAGLSSDTEAEATIWVFENNATGTAAESLTVTVDGPGYVSQGASARPTSGTVATLAYQPASAAAGSPVYVWANGTAGKATITVKTISGLLIATKTVYFFGAVTKLANGADPKPRTIVRSGGKQLTSAWYVEATDAAGQPVTGLTLSCSIANTLVIAACGYTDNSDGTYTLDLTSASGSTSGQTTTVTPRVVDPAVTTSTAYLTAPAVTVTTGSTVNKVTIATDKSSYSPGEQMIVTVTATDASGNPVHDGATLAALSSNKTVTGLANVATSFSGGKADSIDRDTDGTVKTTYRVFAPATSGSFDLYLDYTDAALATQRASVSATVADAAIDAATDAANEATDAANAATDAALAAADAADAATAAAQDASDAVAALSASVSKLISSLRAQITSLTNLVIKIQKKVKA